MKQADEDFSPIWAAGFMSGTSLDAVDAAMILTDGVRVLEFGPVAERKYTPEERAILQDAVNAARDWNWQGDPPDLSAALEVLTATHIAAFEAMLEGWDGPRPAIVGVHGQTVLHRRPKDGAMGATLQILDAEALQAGLDVPLAYDFRSADVAAGGEGAPLAPIYHKALLARSGYENAAALNLGGVANITISEADGALLAFDTGPANGPIDEWVEGHGRGTYDKDGALAGAGRVHEGLLAQLLDHPYFDERPPKSLDRYDFNANLVRGLSLEDGAATLTALAAKAVARGLEHAGTRPEQLIVCGGGRRNPALMAQLEAACPCDVVSAEAAGWRGDSIEAEAFAYLAVRTLRGLPLSFPGTTGVAEAMGGGVVNWPYFGREIHDLDEFTLNERILGLRLFVVIYFASLTLNVFVFFGVAYAGFLGWSWKIAVPAGAAAMGIARIAKRYFLNIVDDLRADVAALECEIRDELDELYRQTPAEPISPFSPEVTADPAKAKTVGQFSVIFIGAMLVVAGLWYAIGWGLSGLF